MQRQGGIEGGAAPVEQVVGAGPTNPQQPGMMAQQPGLVSQAGPQQGIPSQPGIAGKPAGLPVQGAGMMTAQMQQQRMLQQQQNPNNTKAALQNMLTTRMGPGGQPLPPSASVSMAPDGTAANRLQMMNQQLQQGGMMPSPQHSPQQQAIIQQQQQQVRLCCMQPIVVNSFRNYPILSPEKLFATKLLDLGFKLILKHSALPVDPQRRASIGKQSSSIVVSTESHWQ